jgi:exosortase A-associated hydrolase 1
VLVVVGGPQVRAGSHRQFVYLARHLAGQGWPVLRFDVRGMGDSSGALHTFEQISPDIGAAIDGLCAEADVQHVVLWGSCDGASASLLYLHERPDTRVAGLCLLNPWVRSEASLARTQVRHYYRQRLLEADFWRKLLRGGVALSAFKGLVSNVRAARQRPAATPANFQTRMASAWRAFDGPIQLVLSGNDHTAREFLEYTAADPAWAGLLERPQVRRTEFDGADHTFSAIADQRALESSVATWLAKGPWS